MSRSKPSAGLPPRPPEFLVDRNLGRYVPDELTRLGWVVHRIGDEFPDDAQHVGDEEWIVHGLERGWTPLCKDGRIKGRDSEIQPVMDHAACLFYLNNQQLQRAEMASRFHLAQQQIYAAVRRGGPAAYAVTGNGLTRTWP